MMSPSSKRNARLAKAPPIKAREAHPERLPALNPEAGDERASVQKADAGTDMRVVVNRRAALRVRDGHPWVYRSDVVAAHATPGSFVRVVDDRGYVLGTALYSTSSQIAVRMFGLQNGEVRSAPELLRQRIREAIHYRERVVRDSNAFRVLFSEADGAPGLIVDKYNDVITLQVLTQAMDREEMRSAALAELTEHFAPAGIVERVDERIRQLEELPPRSSGLLHGAKSATEFEMNGLRFRFDALAGQKTGAFLDQRENYAAAAQYARGEALDVFCYHGGFALHLSRVCDSVAGVDASRGALEMAEQNEILNRDQWAGREIEWIEANAFELLRDYSDARRQFDTIVLDPPAFAKTKRNLETAIRGYKELNLRALKMLRPGGTLITCSCSFHVAQSEFMQMLTDAARDAHRELRVLETRSQSKDHPVVLSIPETFYLKCVIAAVR
jgi:23S rRNA (cytosine1962-C5)-methyltransferase